MFGAGWLNLGSLVLGLIAWILPVANLMWRNDAQHRNWPVLSAVSITACAISLWLQVLYSNHLVKIEDWSALMDTSAAVALVATILLVVTILLNAAAFVVYYREKSKDQ
jgi:cytochrome c oxidase subunit 4